MTEDEKNHLEPDEISFLDKLSASFKEEREAQLIKKSVSGLIAATNFEKPKSSLKLPGFLSRKTTIIIASLLVLILVSVPFLPVNKAQKDNHVSNGTSVQKSSSITAPASQIVSIQDSAALQKNIIQGDTNKVKKFKRQRRVQGAIKGIPPPVHRALPKSMN